MICAKWVWKVHRCQQNTHLQNSSCMFVMMYFAKVWNHQELIASYFNTCPRCSSQSLRRMYRSCNHSYRFAALGQRITYTLRLLDNPYLVIAPQPCATSLIPFWLHRLFTPTCTKNKHSVVIFTILSAKDSSTLSWGKQTPPVLWGCPVLMIVGVRENLFDDNNQRMAKICTSLQLSKASGAILSEPQEHHLLNTCCIARWVS